MGYFNFFFEVSNMSSDKEYSHTYDCHVSTQSSTSQYVKSKSNNYLVKTQYEDKNYLVKTPYTLPLWPEKQQDKSKKSKKNTRVDELYGKREKRCRNRN